MERQRGTHEGRDGTDASSGGADGQTVESATGAEGRADRLPDRLHAWAIHLLRWLREADRASPVSSAELSALSVVVHAGPLSLAELAAAEQVRPPTMSRLVAGMAERGVVDRSREPSDRRLLRIEASPRGRRLLEEAKEGRLRALRAALGELEPEERESLNGAIELLERLLPE